MGFRPLRAIVSFLLSQFIVGPMCFAENGKVLIQVVDVHAKPVGGVEIGIDGAGGSGTTSNGSKTIISGKDDGKALLSVGSDTKENDWLSFTLLKSPPGKDLTILSPWDYRSLVPSFANKPENFVRIVVIGRNDREALSDGSVLAALTQKIIEKVEQKSRKPGNESPDPQEALRLVAKQYDVPPDLLDSRIRSWGKTATSPYDAGLAALYEQRFAQASPLFEDALKNAKLKLEEAKKEIADAACALGLSDYYLQRFEDSAMAYRECLQFKPNDPGTLLSLGAVLGKITTREGGGILTARGYFCRAFEIEEKTPGPNPGLIELIKWDLAITESQLTAGACSLLTPRPWVPDLPDCGSHKFKHPCPWLK